MTVALSLFGSPEISYGGKSTVLPFERRIQLLAFLALRRSWVGRAELAALLWPEQDTKLAYSNLRKALFRLQSLPWADRIEVQSGVLRFGASTDVLAFENALREHRTREALALHRGALLTGFDDDSNPAWSGWLSFERDRLQAAWRSAAQEHLAGDIDAVEAIDLAARLLEADPLDEAALRAYMGWLARAGQGVRARQAYRDFATRLTEELGLTPSAELKALHDSIGAVGAPASAAVSKTFPTPDDGFIGRMVELRRIAELLSQDDCRLLCVIGPGGIGKTRLARRVIDQLALEFADSASFVPLEDIAAATDLGGRLARELGISLAGSGEPLDQVIEFLRERQALLVLDNFEHLAADASILDRLLAACPRLKILVTSRVRLALANEWLLPLEGLPCPEEEDTDHIETFDASRLFVRAAQRVQPTLVPAVEAAAIVDICRQVEGLPLALELAAAWTRVLSCDAIAAELRQGTELLQAVDAAHPPRHASIEVVFDQSWHLLTAMERDVLARVSVFRGGFSAEAARAVAKAPLPVLGALIDKSLLRKEEARLQLHPLVQQLAAARLGDGPALAETQEAHAAYFHRLLAQLRSAVQTGERAALQAIDVEFENCRRAWTWSIEHDQADALARNSAVLLDYCDHRGRFEVGMGLLRSAIESPVARADAKLQALLLSRASHLEYRVDRYSEAEAMASRALAASRRSRDSSAAKVQALNVLATCALRLGRLRDARRYFKQALELVSSEQQARSTAATLDHLALVEKALGNYDEALRLSRQSLTEYRRLADVGGEALTLNNMGALHIARGEHELAAVQLREGLVLCERHGLVNTRGYILANLTEVALNADDLAAAEFHAARAVELARTTGNRSVLSWAMLKRARLETRRGDIATARATLADGLSIALAIGVLSLKFDAVGSFAEILEAQGEAECARRVLAYASHHPRASVLVRNEIRTRLAGLPTSPDTEPTWPELELDDLLHRIAFETNLAYAPLIATLRSAR